MGRSSPAKKGADCYFSNFSPTSKTTYRTAFGHRPISEYTCVLRYSTKFTSRAASTDLQIRTNRPLTSTPNNGPYVPRRSLMKLTKLCISSCSLLSLILLDTISRRTFPSTPTATSNTTSGRGPREIHHIYTSNILHVQSIEKRT